jgi:rhamnosyltransferase subunit B
MRFLLTSWGSRGDLHPFLALGRGLSLRGHQVTLVGHPEWQVETESAGLRFVGTGEPPRDDFLVRHPEVMSMKWGGLAGLHSLVHEGIAPSFDATLATLLAEAPNHDVIIAHHFVFPAAVAAELTGKPLVNVSLAPGVGPSAYSRPATSFGHAGSGFSARLLNRLIWTAGRVATAAVVDPVVNRLRQRHGLAPIRDAVFGDHFAVLDLQLYSRHFAPLPPDWPDKKRQAAFCFYDPQKNLPAEIENFLASGPLSILFTLGSAAVQVPGSFYREAVETLALLNLRGILLFGPEENRPADLPPTILALPYAPYGLLMPRVRAVVHQCGIGTVSHTLRAGVPSVGCPFAFDQPNNARRLEALGVAEVVLPRHRQAKFLAAALTRLLAGEAPNRAQLLGQLIRAQDGVGQACALLEEINR